MSYRIIITIIILISISLGWVGSTIWEETFTDYEKPSPADIIAEKQIRVYEDEVIIKMNGTEWSNIQDTNSMDPVIDSGTNVLEITPTNPNQINPGDIISYHVEKEDIYIIHRVIKKGVDEQGLFFITKGDNSPVADSEKVRFEQIEGLVYAIIY